MTREFIEPTFESRKKGILLIGIGGIGWLAIELLWSPFMEFVKGLPLCEEIIWLRGIIIVAGLLTSIVSLLLVRRAIRIIKIKQTPLPSDAIISRTRIYRNWRAISEAVMLILLAVVFISGCFWVITLEPIVVIFQDISECANA